MFIDEKLMQADRSRISHDYRPVDKVFALVYKFDKLDPSAIDPFRILRVRVNEMVAIRRKRSHYGVHKYLSSSTLLMLRFFSCSVRFKVSSDCLIVEVFLITGFPSFLDSHLLSILPMFILPMHSFASFFMRG